MAETFICEACGDEIEKNMSDEDVLARAEAVYGPIPRDRRMMICHDCYLEGVARGFLMQEMTDQ